MRAVAALEFLLVMAVVVGALSGLEGYFDKAWGRSKDILFHLVGLQAGEKVYRAINYVAHAPPGTVATVRVYLPEHMGLICKDASLEVPGVKEWNIPLPCHTDTTITGPFEGILKVGRYGGEVVIG